MSKADRIVRYERKDKSRGWTVRTCPYGLLQKGELWSDAEEYCMHAAKELNAHEAIPTSKHRIRSSRSTATRYSALDRAAVQTSYFGRQYSRIAS